MHYSASNLIDVQEPIPPNRPSKGQKNFSLAGGKSWFESFCNANGYDERVVFLAGVLALTEMPHEARAAFLFRVKEWEKSDFSGPPPEGVQATSVAPPRRRPIGSETKTSRAGSVRAAS